ncbi:hypothetical protein EDB85DRAFT_1904219 [Lactarius pseudohatsudake]|nr:hypothetical protein EDB85DRAFT_1904219 [Lactarius pseudohatsudake]
MFFAPIIDRQSPFQTPLTGIIWYVRQKGFPRRYWDRASDGALKNVSPDMSTGKVQLAMEENEKQKGRDVQAIRWLIDNNTEDDEVESFAMTMPDTFTSEWGVEVWRKVSEVKRYEGATSGVNYSCIADRCRPSIDTNTALYIKTFRAITSGWRQHKDCIGTQRMSF